MSHQISLNQLDADGIRAAVTTWLATATAPGGDAPLGRWLVTDARADWDCAADATAIDHTTGGDPDATVAALADEVTRLLQYLHTNLSLLPTPA